ncbi:extracellular solute-binding protein [Paucidesulfovibrio longus]|uniref:extracellular solute-binding protein n=1 Tax=Paucidesulfovibrio longus TaxID=889 RepID=UPI0003B54795|nr:extracellular solute-binding protein [Paucidesulfovibrio longus]
MKKLLLALCLALLPGLASAGGEVYVYNWTEYVPEAVLNQFTEETGIKVIYTTYDSNEAMYAKVKLLGGEGYDVVVPSTYFVNKMRREGLLLPLDRSKLPSFANLDTKFLNKPYDPDNEYSVPYLWGGSGIIANTEMVSAEGMDSWRWLWSPQLKGKLLLQDDLRDVLGIGLLLKGYSVNETDPEHIREAYEVIKTLAPNVLVYNSDNPKSAYLGGEVAGGMIWNGEAYQALGEMDTLKFVWAKEGGLLWMDNFVIPKNAKNVDNAHAFINFMLRPDIAAQCCVEYGYATPNKAAVKLLSAELRESPLIFPPDEVVARSEFQNDVGEAILVYEKYWHMLKAGQ